MINDLKLKFLKNINIIKNINPIKNTIMIINSFILLKKFMIVEILYNIKNPNKPIMPVSLKFDLLFKKSILPNDRSQ